MISVLWSSRIVWHMCYFPGSFPRQKFTAILLLLHHSILPSLALSIYLSISSRLQIVFFHYFTVVFFSLTFFLLKLFTYLAVKTYFGDIWLE